MMRGKFFIMSATVTVNLDSDVLQSAEQEAQTRHTTLSEVVAQQLRVMAQNWEQSRAGQTPVKLRSNSGQTPVTDELRGAVTLPADFDEQAALTEDLQKKHGILG
jgi:hypothetical protein